MALDKLEAMKAFCKIVETGSFKQAAEILGVATTTLSGQIQNFEQQLGVKLLHRTTRKVSATADGLQYYQQISPLLAEIDEINQAMQGQSQLAGNLIVEMPSPVADYLIVPNLPTFAAKYPNLRLEIGSSERVVDLVKDGVDCAIRGGMIADESLVAKVIGQMPFCLCATPEYLAKMPEIKVLDDLHAHRYLSFKFAATGKLDRVRLAGGTPAPIATPVQTFNNAQTYFQAVLAGLGIANVPKVFAQPHIAAKRLRPILPDIELMAMPMSFVYPQSKFTPKRVKVFAEWVEQLVAENAAWQRLG